MAFRVFCWGLVLLCSLSPVVVAEEGLPLDQIRDPVLRKNLRQVGLQVMFGDNLRAMVNANTLGWEVFHKGIDGRERELAFALALQAAAEAGLGMEREALWHWEAAQLLFPELHSEVLQTYSEVAGVFDQSPFSSYDRAAEWLGQQGQLAEGGAQKPIVIEKVAAATPKHKRSALNGSQVTVAFLVDVDGRPWAPKILSDSGNGLAKFSVLQALLSWRCEPARIEGVLIWGEATGHFSFQKER